MHAFGPLYRCAMLACHGGNCSLEKDCSQLDPSPLKKWWSIIAHFSLHIWTYPHWEVISYAFDKQNIPDFLIYEKLKVQKLYRKSLLCDSHDALLLIKII